METVTTDKISVASVDNSSENKNSKSETFNLDDADLYLDCLGTDYTNPQRVTDLFTDFIVSSRNVDFHFHVAYLADTNSTILKELVRLAIQDKTRKLTLEEDPLVVHVLLCWMDRSVNATRRKFITTCDEFFLRVFRAGVKYELSIAAEMISSCNLSASIISEAYSSNYCKNSSNRTTLVRSYLMDRLDNTGPVLKHELIPEQFWKDCFSEWRTLFRLDTVTDYIPALLRGVLPYHVFPEEELVELDIEKYLRRRRRWNLLKRGNVPYFCNSCRRREGRTDSIEFRVVKRSNQEDYLCYCAKCNATTELAIVHVTIRLVRDSLLEPFTWISKIPWTNSMGYVFREIACYLMNDVAITKSQRPDTVDDGDTKRDL